jgi:hypothetical protein
MQNTNTNQYPLTVANNHSMIRFAFQPRMVREKGKW